MSSLIRSTGIIAASTLASRVMGFLRDMLMASFFGATGSTDAFFVAFKIPNLFRRFVAEGSLTISFIPVYTDYLLKKGEDEALWLAQKTFSILILILITIIGAGEFFSPEIVKLFAMGFSDQTSYFLAVDLTRIMFPYLFFVSLVAFSMGVLNSRGYFFAPAFAPVFLNVGMITGIIVLSSFFTQPLYGVAVGVIAGGVMQVILQIPYLIKAGFRMKLSFDFRHPGIRKIMKLLGPAVFGMAIYQINSVVLTVLASFLDAGSISYIYYSDRLTELVLGVFIVSIGNAILPSLSRHTSNNNVEGLKALYLKSISGAFVLALPAAVILTVFGYQIISVLFLRNEFTPNDALMTYRALFYAGLGLLPVSILRLTTPVYYAMKDTRTPVRISAVSMVINLGLGALLMRTGLKHAGLTLALSVATTVQVILLVAVLRKRTGPMGIKKYIRGLAGTLAASAVMGAVFFLMRDIADWNDASLPCRAGALTASLVTGTLVFLIVSYAAGVGEVRFIIRRFIFRK